MLVFVLQTGDRESYPPCGLRVETSENVEELKSNLEYFFGDCEDVADEVLAPLSAASTDTELAAALPALMNGRDWTVYDVDNGYERFLLPED